jgi:ribonuclease Z
MDQKCLKDIITLQNEVDGIWDHTTSSFSWTYLKRFPMYFEDDKVEVHTIPLNHRVYTNGILFKKKETNAS